MLPFYYADESLKAQYESLPQEIKNSIDIYDNKITSPDELNELVRRITAAKMDKLP